MYPLLKGRNVTKRILRKMKNEQENDKLTVGLS